MRTARDNLWLDTSYVPGPMLWGEHEADVAILGGGYTGLGAAYFIKQRFPGKRVIVLESQYVGFGSSGRNSGGVSGILGHNYRNLKQKYGREQSAQLQRLITQSFAVVDELIREHNIACDFERTGRMLVAETERQKRRLEEEIEASQEIGGAAIWLEKQEARSRLGSVDVQAAVRYPNEGIADPVKFLRGMRRVVASLGVEVYERSPCTHIEPGQELSLFTPGGTVRAQAMVLATQAYPNPLKLFHYRVLPFYVYNIATKPLSPAAFQDILKWERCSSDRLGGQPRRSSLARLPQAPAPDSSFDSNGGGRPEAEWTPAGSGEAPSGAGRSSRDAWACGDPRGFDRHIRLT